MSFCLMGRTPITVPRTKDTTVEATSMAMVIVLLTLRVTLRVINAIQSKRPDMVPGSSTWPYITGQDAMEIAVANIAKGMQGQTVFKNVNELADAVYEMIVEIAEGKTVSGLNGKFNNNTIDVPSKLLDPQSITKDNLSDLVTAKYITQDRFDKLTEGTDAK